MVACQMCREAWHTWLTWPNRAQVARGRGSASSSSEACSAADAPAWPRRLPRRLFLPLPPVPCVPPDPAAPPTSTRGAAGPAAAPRPPPGAAPPLSATALARSLAACSALAAASAMARRSRSMLRSSPGSPGSRSARESIEVPSHELMVLSGRPPRAGVRRQYPCGLTFHLPSSSFGGPPGVVVSNSLAACACWEMATASWSMKSSGGSTVTLARTCHALMAKECPYMRSGCSRTGPVP